MSKGMDITSTYTGEKAWRFPVVPLTMTLREHYAGLAMQGLLASEVNVSWKDFAEMSVRSADALIAALQEAGDGA